MTPTVRGYELFGSESHCGQEECSSAGDAARIALRGIVGVNPWISKASEILEVAEL